MPQWSRDRDAISRRHPDERWRSSCARAHAALLLRYDHHVVHVDGRAALLLTYPWLEMLPKAWPDQLPFDVSLTYARGHSTAPAAVQRVIDTLHFTPAPVLPVTGA